MNFFEAQAKYGRIQNGIWSAEKHFCTLVDVPSALAERLINTASGMFCTHIYCNQDMAKPLLSVLNEIIERGLSDSLSTFDGCLMVRNQRGSTKLSVHSYALAVDFDAKKNPQGRDPVINAGIVSVFKKYGFLWGGDFKRKDGMHFQYLADW